MDFIAEDDNITSQRETGINISLVHIGCWTCSRLIIAYSMVRYCPLGMSVVDSIILHCLTKFQVYLRRNSEGEMDPEGDIWAAPYRWGCMVIAYKTNQFQNHKLAPIEVWCFLMHPVILW
jgi:hypothetical protein